MLPVFFLLLLNACFAGKTCNVLDFGAKGDGKADDSRAIQKALEECKPSGVILFPERFSFLTGPFNVSSFQTLQVDGTILATEDITGWPVIADLPSYPGGREHSGPRYCPFVGVFYSEGVTIQGNGTIDGQGKHWWKDHKSGVLNYTRPRLVETFNATSFRIQGVLLTNSPFWTLHLYSSNNVIVNGITVENPSDSPNTDGIDPDSSKNVLITQSKIACGDDHIAIKSGMNQPGLAYNVSSENIEISHCHFGLGNGISLGSEMSGGIHNVWAHDCTFELAGHGLYLKSAPGRGAYIEDIVAEKMKLDGVATAVYVRMNYGGSTGGPLPTFRNITVRDWDGIAGKAGEMTCLADSPCTQFDFERLEIHSPEGWHCENIYGVSHGVHPSISACIKDQP